MRVGYKMDYGKMTDILSTIWVDAIELERVGYLPSDFWTEFEDELQLSTYITAGWAQLTEEGQFRIQDVWNALCEIRGLDPDVMYDNLTAFFEAQAVKADVIPLKRGK